jgi:hypothetical protein
MNPLAIGKKAYPTMMAEVWKGKEPHWDERF